MNLLLLLSGFFLSNSTITEYGNVEVSNQELLWNQYKETFDKSYETGAEELFRRRTFFENDRLIDKHNELFAKGVYSFELGHNQFSDMTHDEYLEQYVSEETSEEDAENIGFTVKYDDVSDELNNAGKEFTYIPPTGLEAVDVDWRNRGAVTAVKNEGKCHASWAFSATGALEGQLYMHTHHLIALSEQNLVDCTKKYGNRGCKSGSSINAYRYIISNGGLNTNFTYPWKGKHAWLCHYKKTPTNPIIHGISHVQGKNETALAAAVAHVGPIAVAIDARSNKFKFYKSGIYTDHGCSKTQLNREALVVGYTRQYWILKNSWGTKWGNRGYIFMRKNGTNQCGVATRPIFPIV